MIQQPFPRQHVRMQRILSEETWQLLLADIERLIELNRQLKHDNQFLREENAQMLALLNSTEQRLTPILQQLLSQQDDSA